MFLPSAQLSTMLYGQDDPMQCLRLRALVSWCPDGAGLVLCRCKRAGPLCHPALPRTQASLRAATIQASLRRLQAAMSLQGTRCRLDQSHSAQSAPAGAPAEVAAVVSLAAPWMASMTLPLSPTVTTRATAVAAAVTPRALPSGIKLTRNMMHHVDRPVSVIFCRTRCS